MTPTQLDMIYRSGADVIGDGGDPILRERVIAERQQDREFKSTWWLVMLPSGEMREYATQKSVTEAIHRWARRRVPATGIHICEIEWRF